MKWSEESVKRENAGVSHIGKESSAGEIRNSCSLESLHGLELSENTHKYRTDQSRLVILGIISLGSYEDALDLIKQR